LQPLCGYRALSGWLARRGLSARADNLTWRQLFRRRNNLTWGHLARSFGQRAQVGDLAMVAVCEIVDPRQQFKPRRLGDLGHSRLAQPLGCRAQLLRFVHDGQNGRDSVLSCFGPKSVAFASIRAICADFSPGFFAVHFRRFASPFFAEFGAYNLRSTALRRPSDRKSPLLPPAAPQLCWRHGAPTLHGRPG